MVVFPGLSWVRGVGKVLAPRVPHGAASSMLRGSIPTRRPSASRPNRRRAAARQTIFASLAGLSRNSHRPRRGSPCGPRCPRAGSACLSCMTWRVTFSSHERIKTSDNLYCRIYKKRGNSREPGDDGRGGLVFRVDALL